MLYVRFIFKRKLNGCDLFKGFQILYDPSASLFFDNEIGAYFINVVLTHKWTHTMSIIDNMRSKSYFKSLVAVIAMLYVISCYIYTVLWHGIVHVLWWPLPILFKNTPDSKPVSYLYYIYIYLYIWLGREYPNL